MIYYFNIHFPDARNLSNGMIFYRDSQGWIITYFKRRKIYGKLFEEYGYMYL